MLKRDCSFISLKRRSKTKNFLSIFGRLPPRPPPRKRRKVRNIFGFCFAVSVSEKNNLILTFLFALFSALTARRGASSRRSVVVLIRATPFTDGGKPRKWSLAIQNSLRNGEVQICMCLPHTHPARTNPRR